MPHRQSAHQRICKLSSWDQISSAHGNPELLSVMQICITWMCMTWKSCWKGWLSTKIGDGDLLKVAKKLWTVFMYSSFSNKLLSSWDLVLGKNRTEHNKAATLTWLVVSSQLSRQQVFVRIFSRPKVLYNKLRTDLCWSTWRSAELLQNRNCWFKWKFQWKFMGE